MCVATTQIHYTHQWACTTGVEAVQAWHPKVHRRGVDLTLAGPLTPTNTGSVVMVHNQRLWHKMTAGFTGAFCESIAQ